MRSLTIITSRIIALTFIGAGLIFTRDPTLGAAFIFSGIVIWIVGALLHWRLPRRKQHVVRVWGEKVDYNGTPRPYHYASVSDLSMEAARERMVDILKLEPTFTVTKWEEVSG